MKKNNALNKVILIGSNHLHTLGLVRSFGINGIRPYGIMLKTKKIFSNKSKYWEKIYEIDSLDELIDVLMEHFSNEELKPVVIPMFDENVEIIDKNLSKLKDYFILPSINEREGAIIDLMDKQSQYELAKNNNIEMMPCITVDLENFDIDNFDVKLPCILKPVASVEGLKEDIKICYDRESLEKAVNNFKSLKYNRVLAQHYLEKRREFDCQGSISKEGKYVLTVLENVRRYPIDVGIGTYAVFTHDKNIINFAKKLFDIAAEIGYNGPIDIEFFLDEEGIFYLNEYNWRTGGRNYVSLYNGIHHVYEYYLDAVGIKKMKSKCNKKHGYIIDEQRDLKAARELEVPVFKWLKQLFGAKSYAFWYLKDLRPTLCEYKRLLKIMLKK